MIFTQINWKGKVVKPYQIENKKCYFFKNGVKIDFQYRLAEIPDYYVAGGELHLDSETSRYDSDLEALVLSSLYHYSVSEPDSELIIH